MPFGDQWEQGYRRRWWQKLIDGPLDALAFLLQVFMKTAGWPPFDEEEDEEPTASPFSRSEEEE